MVAVGSSAPEFADWLGRQRELLQILIRDANITLS